MKKTLLLLVVSASLLACSKSRKDDTPAENSASFRIGSKLYSFSAVPNASDNYFDATNGLLQFKLVGVDGASLKINSMYLNNITIPFEAIGSTGAPPPPSASVVFTDAGGSVYNLRTVEETPWFTLRVKSVKDKVWTGEFFGYVQNAANQRIDLSEGQFRVSLTEP